MLTSDRVCISECCYISARVVVLCFGLFASHRHAPSLEVIPDAPVYCSRLNTSEIDTSIFRYLDFHQVRCQHTLSHRYAPSLAVIPKRSDYSSYLDTSEREPFNSVLGENQSLEIEVSHGHAPSLTVTPKRSGCSLRLNTSERELFDSVLGENRSLKIEVSPR